MGVKAIRRVFGKVVRVDKNGMPVQDSGASEQPAPSVQEKPPVAAQPRPVQPPVAEKPAVPAVEKKTVSDKLSRATSKKKNKRN
ncbi:hypothetical protein CMI47_06905 [Candidatus Pacearchaeota archaeon]|nr:hypothetical protein [Candidatus Pacearchaeota archaeon]|tara:strand:+ start:127 stop:378 length:252 start_codon:yes stop_codon:yes gene_type:complete